MKFILWTLVFWGLNSVSVKNMKLSINTTGRPKEELWQAGFRCWLIFRFCGMYLIGYEKGGDKNGRRSNCSNYK